MGILIGVFCVAIYTDWRYYRIPNACIVIGMAAGLTRTAVSCSWSDLICALAAAAGLFLMFYPFYLLGALGAGDVKLFMMMGCHQALIGTDGLIHYMFVTMILAAMISMMKMTVYTQSRGRLLYLIRYLRKVVLTGAVDVYKIDKTQRHCVVRLSIPAFVSFILLCIGVYK